MVSPLAGTSSTKQTNKQNITKHIETENKLTVTRGERGENFGKEGDGFSGTIIKDTWTITRMGVETGEVCGKGWVEKAENCS